MLNELEAIELKVSEVLEDNESFRMDAEYFKKEYLELKKTIYQYPHQQLGNFSKVTDGEHGSVTFEDDGIKYLTAEHIKEGFIDISSIRYVNKEVDIRNKRASVEVNDILLSIKGTLGEVAIADKWLLPANMNRDVAIIKNREKDNFLDGYIVLFLMSKIGRKLSEREGSGGVQQMITLARLRTLMIPKLTVDFQLMVSRFYQKSREKIIESEFLYKEAETILLKELDLLDFEPTQENIAIKSFSESFLATGRLDSEYYQPKYDEIIEKIRDYRGGVEIIANVCNLKDSNHKPISDKHYQYIELSNIGTTGDITGFTYNLGKKLPSRARRLVKENDIIISSIEGSLEKVALVTEEFNSSLCSTGFYILNSNKINSETLLVLFKNRIMQQILKQNCSGTILTAMNKDEFLNIAIPLIDLKIQTEISEKIKTSFQLKSESKEFLELAKRAVEVAIEEGEDVAMKLIGESYE